MHNKYKCLLDAVKNSGLELPPIKDGTTVKYSTSDIPPPDLGISADFSFETREGTNYQVRANDALSSDEGRYKIFGIGKSQEKDITRATAEIAAKVEDVTGDETVYAKSPDKQLQPGTVSRTVDKIFGCLDPNFGS